MEVLNEKEVTNVDQSTVMKTTQTHFWERGVISKAKEVSLQAGKPSNMVALMRKLEI